MKKISIFGGTGVTGLCAIEAALKQGLEVTALVRDPSLMPEELCKQVQMVKGDVLNKHDVDKVVAGSNAVVVTLGTRNDFCTPTTIMSDGLVNILRAMEENNVKTISVCLSSFLFYDKTKVPGRYRGISDDHARMLHLLQQFESLNWIAVMTPHIGYGHSRDYTVQIGSSPGFTISKHDLGEFMIECLTKPVYYKQQCGLATKI